MIFRSLAASALVALVSACAQTGAGAPSPLASEAWIQTQAHLPDGGPPVDADGLYNGVGSCPGEGCAIALWQVMREPVSLYAQPNRTAAVVATLSAGEWVRAGERVHRWRPGRGVVAGEMEAAYGAEERHLKNGDVVYSIDYEGEGWVAIWRRGDTFSSDGSGIVWDEFNEAQHAADQAGGGGFWLQMHRENGQTGWMLGEHLTCYPNDLSEECAERNRLGQ